jgi:hypothetical protein
MHYKTVVPFLAVLLLGSCAVMVGPDQVSTETNPPSHQNTSQSSHATAQLFPFDDITNWWRYSDGEGNQLSIAVTDTISDDGVMYYRVAFREQRVDTTEDWFTKSSQGIKYGLSLAGSYNTFLPARFDSARGSFLSSGQTVTYTFHDTLDIGAVSYVHAYSLQYTVPLLHKFEEIAFADSVGMVRFTDSSGRWPVVYALDSCSVYGKVLRL